MNRDDFVVFPGSDTGIRTDRIIAWLLGDDEAMDKNGNPVRCLKVTVQGTISDYTLVISNPEDVKAFLAGVWSQSDLARLLLQACEQATNWIDAAYNDGREGDPRPHWGDCPDWDALYNQLHQVVALAKGEPFTPRE